MANQIDMQSWHDNPSRVADLGGGTLLSFRNTLSGPDSVETNKLSR